MTLNKNELLLAHNAIAKQAGLPAARYFKSRASAEARLQKVLDRQIEAATKAKTPAGQWVRYVSTQDEKYTLVISPRSIERSGVPLDPWGKKMVVAATRH